MKAIMVIFDSLNRNRLSPYGCEWTKTPNFKRLAKKAVTFDTCYVGSLPCMPARRELHTGRYNFLHRSWGPIEPFDDSMPELLSNAGFYTHLISDHKHYWEDGGATYHQRYNSWEIVRGQEGDKWKGHVKAPEIPKHSGTCERQDQVNRTYIQREEDQSQARVFKLGLKFLEKNRNEDNWFLHLETFDPHEPFYVAQKYKDLYPHDYRGPLFDWPPYAKVSEERDAVEHVRFEYAALLSMCNAYLGKILDFMDTHDMWNDTLLIVNTDHGFLLGEHDCWAKTVHPMYEEIVHIPFFVWDPRRKICGERRKALVQTIDIAPTLLEYFGLSIPADMQGKPLGTVLDNDTSVRDGALFAMHGAHINVTDGRYVYMRKPLQEKHDVYEYTQMPTHMNARFSVEEMRTMTVAPPFDFTKETPLMKIDTAPRLQAEMNMYLELSKAFLPPDFDQSKLAGLLKAYDPAQMQGETSLYDILKDPKQEHPIEDVVIEERMATLMKRLMKENDAPPEQFERMGL
jgi:arylsulfatase A-like enzyme